MSNKKYDFFFLLQGIGFAFKMTFFFGPVNTLMFLMVYLIVLLKTWYNNSQFVSLHKNLNKSKRVFSLKLPEKQSCLNRSTKAALVRFFIL